MPILSLNDKSYGPRGSLRRSRGPANFGTIDMVIDASTIPVSTELMAKWQKAWLEAYNTASAIAKAKISKRTAEMATEGYSQSEIASVANMASDSNPGFQRSVIYTEMPLLGLYYDIDQDKVVSADEMKSGNLDLLSSKGVTINGSWNEFAENMIKVYQGWQTRKYNEAAGIAADNVVAQAQRVAGQINLEIFGRILSGYKKYLTEDDLQFLNFMFTDWKTAKSASEQARFAQIMQMLASKGFSYSASSDVATRMDKIQQVVDPNAAKSAAIYQQYQQELAQNGTIDAMKKAYMQSYESIQNQISNVRTLSMSDSSSQVVSNGGSVALTAKDWEGAQSNQQSLTAVNDATRISPLQTAFMTAGHDISADVNAIQQQTQKNPNIALYAILGFIAFKFLRR